MDPALLAQLMEMLGNDPATFPSFMSQMRANYQKYQGPPKNGGDSIVQQISKAKEVFRRERMLPPSPAPPPTPRAILRLLFEQERCKMLKRESSGDSHTQTYLRSSYIGAPIDFSRAPLSSLTRIRIRDMMVRKRHLGNYFLGRTITPASQIVAIQFAAEDPEGDPIHIALYHFPAPFQATSKFLDAIFDIGTMFVIREPRLKMPSSGGNSMIRVDSPSDIIFVNYGDPLLDSVIWKTGSSPPQIVPRPTTFSGWKALGDRQFRDQQFLAAVLLYTEGLKLNPTNPTLLLNRSMAYLRIEFFSRALKDCTSVLQFTEITDQERGKAFHRAGRAMYGLGKWSSAKVYFEDAVKISESKESRMWSKKCDARRKEQETGEFDVVEMYKRSKTEGNRMDVADFVGHVTVTTMDSRGGGRAVVATQDLRAGELLVLAKPFASVFEEDFHGSQELHIVLNLITDTSHGKCHGYLISKIATILFGELVKADLIYHLYCGPNFSKSPSRYPPDIPKPSSQHEDTPLFNDQVAVDVARIQAVASFNCFAPKPLSPVVIEERVKNKNKTEERLKRPSALYTFPSLFNHSCVPNCSQDFIGDVIVIRALQDISQGTELTLSYGNAGNTFEKRKEHLKKWFDKCDCALCEVERLDGAAACETRERVVAQIKQAAKKPETRSSAQEAKRYLKEIQGTYRSSTDSRLPRIALYEAHFHLGNQLEALGNIVGLVEEHIKGVRALGVNVIDDSISGPLQPGKRVTALPIEIDGVPFVPGGLAIWACLALTTHFLHGFGDKIRAERWLRAARWMVNVMHGGGDELFKIMYEEQLDLWSILDFNRLIGP